MEIDRSALIQTFLAEAGEQLDAMAEGLAALATRPGDAQVLRDVFLLAHTLKGSAATVGLDGVTELARAMKDAADNRRRQVIVTPELLTLLRQTVSAIRQALPLLGGNAPAPSADDARLVARLALFALPPEDGAPSTNYLADETLRTLK
jgi:two-component system chemotaxis sensor kinase CheA